MDQFSWDHFRSFPVIGILRSYETELVLEIFEQALAAGLKNIEITMNSSFVKDQIPRLRQIAGSSANVGAGTVLTLDDLSEALALGAQFIVTPIVNIDVIKACVKKNIPVFPGAYTPTEVYTAWKAGASMVKLFPADQGGPNYLKTLHGPLDQIEIIAVNGVRVENVPDYLSAGAKGFGLGGTFFDKKKMLEKDWKWMHSQIKAFKKFF